MQAKIEDSIQPPAPMMTELSYLVGEVTTSTVLSNEQQPSPSQKTDTTDQATASQPTSSENEAGEACTASNSTKEHYIKKSEILKPQQQTLRWRKDAPNNKNNNLIPWAYNGQRTISSLFMRLYYACRIECIRWLKPAGHQKNVVRVYLEARGEWDLRHPSISTFRMFWPTKGNGEKVRGSWVSELSSEEEKAWGHYKGYLELPVSFFEHAAGATLTFCYSDIAFKDYPVVPLLKFPEALSKDQILDGSSNLELLFRGIGKDDDNINIEEDLTPNSAPFPVDASFEIEKVRWGNAFPEEVMVRFDILQQSNPE